MGRTWEKGRQGAECEERTGYGKIKFQKKFDNFHFFFDNRLHFLQAIFFVPNFAVRF